MQINRTMSLREWGMLIFLSLLWGGSFFFSKIALAELRPFTVVLGRVGIAALALHILIRIIGQEMPREPRLWGSFALMGLLNNLLPFSLIFYGQTRITSGLASILNATTPLWTVLLAHFLTRDERMSPNRMIGVIAGISGAIVLIGPNVLRGLGLDVIAQCAVLGAAIAYACAGIFGRRFRGIPPMVTATGQVTTTAIMMLPIAAIVDQPWNLPFPHTSTIAALLGLALLSTALAYAIYFRLLSSAGATNLLLVTFLIPISALLLGTGILGEQLDPRAFVGMALIGCGLAAIDGRPIAWLRKR